MDDGDELALEGLGLRAASLADAVAQARRQTVSLTAQTGIAGCSIAEQVTPLLAMESAIGP